MILAAFNLITVYVILGPCIWVGAFIGMAIGWSRVNRLRKDLPSLPENPPHVTILVPAKDEEGGIAGCIERIAEQEYPSFDIVAVDDRSTDRTGVILDEVAREMNLRMCSATEVTQPLDSGCLTSVRLSPKLRVLHIEQGRFRRGGSGNVMHCRRLRNWRWENGFYSSIPM